MIPEANPPKQSATLFLPEHQHRAASELHQKINDSLSPFFGKIIDDAVIEAMGRAVQEAVKDWNQKYPILNKYNIGFELKSNSEGKITLLPSFDFQRLLAGHII